MAQCLPRSQVDLGVYVVDDHLGLGLKSICNMHEAKGIIEEHSNMRSA